MDLASKEASWEEVLEYVIREEGMDPWDVDVVKLADAFRVYVTKAGVLEFKVPARLIMIAAVLLHMKAEVLMWEEEQRNAAAAAQGPPIDITKVPELQVPAKRVPTRRVTLDELVSALEKAFSTQERREVKVERARERVEEVVADEGFDVTKKINELYARISETVEQLKSGTMPFSSLVTKWERREIVQSLLGVLHMSNDGRVTLEQEEPFKEIYVRVSEGKEARVEEQEDEDFSKAETIESQDSKTSNDRHSKKEE